MWHPVARYKKYQNSLKKSTLEYFFTIKRKRKKNFKLNHFFYLFSIYSVTFVCVNFGNKNTNNGKICKKSFFVKNKGGKKFRINGDEVALFNCNDIALTKCVKVYHYNLNLFLTFIVSVQGLLCLINFQIKIVSICLVLGFDTFVVTFNDRQFSFYICTMCDCLSTNVFMYVCSLGVSVSLCSFHLVYNWRKP